MRLPCEADDGLFTESGNPIYLPVFDYICSQTGIWDEAYDFTARITSEKTNVDGTTTGYKSAVKIGRKLCFVKGACAAVASENANIIGYFVGLEQLNQPVGSHQPELVEVEPTGGEYVIVHESFCSAPSSGGVDDFIDEWKGDGPVQLCIPQQGGGGGWPQVVPETAD